MVIPKDQPFVIKNIQSLFDQNVICENDFEVFQLENRIKYMINQILLPLCKKVDFVFLDGTKSNGNYLDTDLVLQFDKDWRLKTVPGLLLTRVSSLFFRMIQTDHLTLNVPPEYGLKFLGEKLQSMTDISRSVQELFQKHIPPGYSFQLSSCSMTMQCGKFSFLSPPTKTENFISLSVKEEYQLKLQKTYEFKSLWAFRKHMRLAKEIRVPANQSLKIEGESLNGFVNHNFFPPLVSLLNGILSPLGRWVEIEGDGVKWEVVNDCLIICSEESFALVTSSKYFFPKLQDLGRELINERKFCCKLEPSQSIWISDFKREELGDWFFDNEKVKSGLFHFLAKRSPLGFCWEIQYFSPLNLGTRSISCWGKTIEVFEIRSSREMVLKLTPASEEVFLLGILNSGSKKLMKSFQEHSVESIKHLLFCVFWFYCTGYYRNFRFAELPPSLKESTRAKMMDFLDRDEEFKEALTAYCESADLQLEFEPIYDFSPEEFDHLDLDKFSPPLRNLFKKLMSLVYEEIQGSQFVRQMIGWVANFLQNS